MQRGESCTRLATYEGVEACLEVEKSDVVVAFGEWRKRFSYSLQELDPYDRTVRNLT